MSLDRRTTIKWMFAAAAAVPALQALGYSPQPQARDVAADQAGYGTDPNLTREWKAGGPWPLTLGVSARLTTAALCDLIIPADGVSPSASSAGVVDFIDEWISAPYPQQRADRALILPGLTWLEAESQGRYGLAFAALSEVQKEAIANDICSAAKAAPQSATAARFFAKFRDLTAGGFYTTPVGMKDIGYVGNIPMEKFAGPPPEVLKKVGLA
ncbi:MAG TPA: gluconate 2-dehydrogenase subunit 3 family protein [Steroidobacteraceae bacterium]|nr:gluconate 2-dehydrogenase subunit 3 family protein [Steroidobacteraceae bacterium]